jgi:hypothetical protein
VFKRMHLLCRPNDRAGCIDDQRRGRPADPFLHGTNGAHLVLSLRTLAPELIRLVIGFFALR